MPSVTCPHCNYTQYQVYGTYECYKCGITTTVWYAYPRQLEYYKTEKDPENPLFVGIELELKPNTAVDPKQALKIKEAGPPMWMGMDGSNIEMRTMPLSRKWIYANKDKFESWFKALEDTDWKETDHAGIHIHLSKQAFASTKHKYRFLKLIYENPKKCKKFANRDSERWAAFYKQSEKQVRDKANNGNDSKFQAVNVGNSQTFEVRIFRSTKDLKVLWQYLEFLFSVFDFTMRTKDLSKITWDHYLAYTNRRKKIFNHAKVKLKTIKKVKESPYRKARENHCSCGYGPLCPPGDCESCDEHFDNCDGDDPWDDEDY